MIEKGYSKNLTKLKNRLQHQSNRPSFLEDEYWQQASKTSTQSKRSYKVKPQIKNSKVFDLEKIKQQLGLIQLKNSVEQEGTNMIKIQKIEFSQSPALKKSKPQTKEESDKRFKPKNSNVVVREIYKQKQEQSGLTQRISELVKMRMQHEKIISSLVQKKNSNQFIEQKSSTLSREKNQAFSSDYIMMAQLYQVQSTQQKQREKNKNINKIIIKSQSMKSNDRDQSQKKKRKSNGISEQMNDIINQKIRTNEQITNNLTVHNLSLTEKQIIQPQAQVKKLKNFTELKISSKQVSRITQYAQEITQRVDLADELNESTFEMQQHVNLLASLSQFQYTNRKKELTQKDIPIQSQLHYSILLFLQKAIIFNNKFNKFALKSISQIDIKYAGIDSDYQDYRSFMNAVKRMKRLDQDFIRVIQFLIENQIWQGLFRFQKSEFINEKIKSSIEINQFYGLCFDSGNYIELLLSNSQIKQTQKNLLIFKPIDNETFTCDITLILLSRLIDLQTNPHFPQMLNRLFGYQLKTFNIDRLKYFMQFLDYIDRLRDIHNKQLRNIGGLIVDEKEDKSLMQRYSLQLIQQEESRQQAQSIQILQDIQKHCEFQLLGYNKTTKGYELIRPSLFSEKNKTYSTIQLYEFRQLMKHQRYTKKLSQTYSKLCVINKKQYPVKSINLKHYQNHFIVVSINVVEEGLYFIGIGQKNQNIVKVQQDHQNETKYRLCLISVSTKTILQCLILQRNQSYPVYLPKEEFEFYISAYESYGTSQDSSNIAKIKQRKLSNNQIFNFTFYIQSQHVVAKHDFAIKEKMIKKQLQFELRLKEQYKNYTSMIVEQFIEFSFLEKEVTKFFQSIHYKIQNQNKQLNNQIQRKNEANKHNSGLTKNKSSRKTNSIFLNDCDAQSQKSYHFSNIQSPRSKQKVQQRQIHSFALNQSKLQNKKIQKNQSKLSYELLSNDMITFDDLNLTPSICRINILRLHLKALDLFIDYIDLTLNQNTNFNQQQNTDSLTLRYTMNQVLCDSNHQKNSVQLKPNTMNLVYLTKNSEILSIKNQNEFCQKTIQRDIQNKEIDYKIFRKEW